MVLVIGVVTIVVADDDVGNVMLFSALDVVDINQMVVDARI